jgi:Cu/Ag efflux protein CusF
MKIATIIMASAVALLTVDSAALAQQTLTGTITKIDRISGTVAIQQTQSGTVGANTGGATEFKVQNGGMLEAVHAGDRVSFSVTGTDSTKTVTNLEKQKP